MDHLTIRQARNEVEKLENELDLYLTQKKINFEKTQPGAVKYKDIVTNPSVIFDKFTHYVIKDEQYDAKIYSLTESILAYETFINNEMKRISSNNGNEYIVYLRDELKLKWNDIVRISHYSLRQCHRLYDEAKK